MPQRGGDGIYIALSDFRWAGQYCSLLKIKRENGPSLGYRTRAGTCPVGSPNPDGNISNKHTAGDSLLGSSAQN
jgi:hypothetical protein